MFAARTAKLFGLHAFGVLLLVFGGGVISILALTALQRDHFSHFSDSLFPERAPAFAGTPLKITR
jgi:hypothetical protein